MFKGFWVLILGCLVGSTTMAQDNPAMTGKWYGVFKLYYGEKKRVIVDLQPDGAGYTGHLQLPDLPESETLDIETVVYRKDTLLLRISEVGFAYSGVWDAVNRQFKGIASFGNDKGALDLGKKEVTKEELYNRPQEPKPPFPYLTQEVRFNNIKDKVSLSGTFTRPAAPGKYPVVVMLSGSGPQNRDEEIAGHKLFLVLADYFARNGIASLRYDDRGVGNSTGVYDSSSIYDFAHDAITAMGYLKTRTDVDVANIGLLGHSEGAMIAEIAAANNPLVAFVISMAGPGLPGRELVDRQLAIKSKLAGDSDSAIIASQKRLKPYWDLLASDRDLASLKPAAEAMLRKLYQSSSEEEKKQLTEDEMVQSTAMTLTPEAISILRFKPAEYLKQIKCPVMAINGTEDIQVDATANLNAISRSLNEYGNLLTTIRKFDGLNHLFQRCKTCRESEYGELEQTIDPLVPAFITHWILQL
ncbi:alpha/beta hydrolase [Chitinophaga polysaccharea]|uniref:alpha/beta hydrolase family protein n=1 Tax=Chitinophaga polysaccharea TaxID=1293035 RepID=UPI0014557A98|nr:alpha/beta hydrolase [Chitinophaga polysaccharea]NLR62191.1 alpha/beta hydrolase [Chitinophaga polysaccharea]